MEPVVQNSSNLTPSREPLKVEVLDFSKLKGLTFESLIKSLKFCIANPNAIVPDRKLLLDLADVLKLDKIQMSRMNRDYKVIPNDSAENFIKNVLLKGTRIVAIRAVEKIGLNFEDRLVGFGRFYLTRDLIPDLADIPKHIKKNNICRVDRLFINDDGREYFNGSKALDSILGKMEEMANGRTIVAKLLIGPKEIGATWLKAQSALINRGYETSGDAEYETFSHGDGNKIDALFTWATYPPQSGPAIAQLENRNTYLESLDVWRQKRLSWVLPHIAPEGQQILVLSGENDGHSLASMYPGNWVTSVRPRSNSPHQKLKNLRSINASELHHQADAWADIIYCSSAIPDLIGSARDESTANTLSVIKTLASKLKPGGVLVMRETAARAHNSIADLIVKTDDAVDGGISTARKLETFIKMLDENSYLPDGYVKTKGKYIGSNEMKFRVPTILADEFLYMVKYFKDWNWEIHRRYCATNAISRSSAFAAEGLTETLSAWERNEWTRENVWKDHVRLLNIDGTPCPLPKGSHINIIRKPADSKPTIIISRHVEKISEAKFLRNSVYRALSPDSAGEIVEVIGWQTPTTYDAIPTFKDENGANHILLKTDSPRPLIQMADPSLDGSKISENFIEQLAKVSNYSSSVDASKVSEIMKTILNERANVSDKEIIEIDSAPMRYFPFLGTSKIADSTPSAHLYEEVVSVFSRIRPKNRPDFPSECYSGFSKAGIIQAVEIGRVHQASIVGSIRDGRVERAAYELAYRNHDALPKWLGDAIKIPLSREKKVKIEKMSRVKYDSTPYHKIEGRKLETPIYSAEFQEIDSEKNVINTVQREFFKPPVSTNIASILPVRLVGSENKFDIVVGLEKRESPVIYNHTDGKRSWTLAIPAFELPKTMPSVEAYISETISENYGAETSSIKPLGSSYFTSVGILAAQINPYIQFVDSIDPENTRLRWFKLEDVLLNRCDILDAQTFTSIFRTAHALNTNLNLKVQPAIDDRDFTHLT